MFGFVLRRLAYMGATVFVIITITFAIMHAIPGDPFLSEKKVNEAIRANLLRKYDLDKPLDVQFVRYVRNVLNWDLGMSMYYVNRNVQDMIRDGFPVSAKLGLAALAFAVVAGLVLGIVAALGHNRLPDYTAMVIAVIGIAVPGFIIGTILQWYFGVKLRALPVSGWGQPTHVVMPAFVLGLGTLALTARMMRSSVLDVLGQDYIRTARAKGLSWSEIVWRHTLRNALLPIVTIMGPTIVNITTGSFITERIFAIPGLGKFFVESITNSDYSLILGTTLFYGILLVVALFLVDMAYGFVDPRIRLFRGRG